MTEPIPLINDCNDPLEAFLLGSYRAPVLCIISHIEGSSYRPLGAIMTVFNENDRVGTLSSGCIEKDIAIHAMTARESGQSKTIRYGQGSPYMDHQLPCGGGLEILLLPNPDLKILRKIARRQQNRQPSTLLIDVSTGHLSLSDHGQTERIDNLLHLLFEPDLRFIVFGKGDECLAFANLVQASGYHCTLLSPDEETLCKAQIMGCKIRLMTKPQAPKDLIIDQRTAIVLFFHDHDWEPPILKDIERENAFYIGAQGSHRARDKRIETLRNMGVSGDFISRLHGPIGLIPSTRDPQTLSVSVLAEILNLVEIKNGI